jgi:hypothetical protein
MTPSPSTTVADRLFGVGHRVPGDVACLDVVAPTCEQAFEAVCHRLQRALQVASPEVATGLEAALVELATTGPSRDGWHRVVAGVEFWYGPAPIRRPRGVTLGEAALLFAIGAGRRVDEIDPRPAGS